MMLKIQQKSIDSLFSHHHFLFKLRDYIQEVVKPEENNIPEQQEQPLDKIIDEISVAILGLSQPSFLKDIQQIKAELQAKFSQDLEGVQQQVLSEAMQGMKKYCEEQIQKALLENRPKEDLLLLVSNQSYIGERHENANVSPRFKGNKSGDRIREERKILTESILECSRIEGSQKHIHEHEGYQSAGFIPQPSQAEVNKTQAINWHETSLTLKNRLKEVEQECQKVLKATNKWHIDQSKRIQQLYQDVGALRVQVMEKVEGAFSGVWNIVTNLEQKFGTLQALVAKMKK